MGLSKNQKVKFLKVALSANKKAEAFIKKKIVQGFTTKTKQDGSFVTTVDTGAEKIIRNEIKKAFPDHNITGEELGASDKHSDYRWFLDPIDGTLSFKLGLPVYGTIIFLCYKSKPILCVINHPSLNLLYYATLGGGAFCNNKKLRLKDASRIQDELIATGDRYAFKLAGKLTKYKKLVNKHPLVRTIPDCYGHSLAAKGTVGAMVDYYLNYWDYAATKLLVEEAGGKFVITGSKKLANGKTAYNMICGKPKVVNWLLRTLK